MQTAVVPHARRGARAVVAVAATIGLSLTGIPGAALAQTLRLTVDAAAIGDRVRTGDVIPVQLRADLQSVPAAGIAAYVTIPDGLFEVRDLGLPGQAGVQPFRLGDLFEGAQMPTNLLLPESDPVAAALPGRQLDLAVLSGPGAAPLPDGEGLVATFELVALSASEGARLHLDDTPVREAKLVRADGRTETRFRALAGLDLRLEANPVSAITPGGWGRLKERVRPPR